MRLIGVSAAATLAISALGAPMGTVSPPAASAPALDQVEALKSMLVGSWKADGKPGTDDEAGFWMHIAPVSIEGMDNALYVEQARGEAPAEPYRQAVFQVYLNRGKLRLRTVEFRNAVERGGPWALAWLAPESFPAIDPDSLIATLDLEFKAVGDGFEGRTPYPYPNANGGAVEMTSEMKVLKDRMVTSDKGYGPDGSVVWGDSGSDSFTWTRSDPGFSAKRDDDGLTVITIAEPEQGDAPADGDTMFVDYSLWLADGTAVDSAAKSGRLMSVAVPIAQNRLIGGFIRGLEGTKQGSIRRIIVPPALGYGETQRGPIPANSTLYFQVEVVEVQKPVAPDAPEQAQPEAGQDDEGGGGH